MSPALSAEQPPCDLRLSMQKLLDSRGHACGADEDDVGAYIKPARRLRLALEQVLDDCQAAELDSLLRSPYLKPSEGLLVAVDKALGFGRPGSWETLFRELRAAIWESAALTKSIELVQSLLGSQGVSARSGLCTPPDSSCCTPRAEPDSEPPNASPRRSSSATASRRLSARRSRALLAHAPRGTPSRRASKSPVASEDSSQVARSLEDPHGRVFQQRDVEYPPSTLEPPRGPNLSRERSANSNTLGGLQASAELAAGRREELDAHATSWESKAIAKSECVMEDWPEWTAQAQEGSGRDSGQREVVDLRREFVDQADDLDDEVDARQAISQRQHGGALCRLYDSDSDTEEEKEIGRFLGARAQNVGSIMAEEATSCNEEEETARSARMNEITRRLQEVREQEELRKLKVARMREEEEEALRREEEARIRQAEIEKDAAMKYAQTCFRNSMDSLLRTIDMGSNEALQYAKDQLREIVVEAKENGLPEAELTDAIVWERRLVNACVKNVLEACRAADTNNVDVLRNMKEKLTNVIGDALDHGVSEIDLADAETWRRRVHNRIEDIKGSIRVFCRVRPLNSREEGQGDTSIVRQLDSMALEIERVSSRSTPPRRVSSRSTPRSAETECDMWAQPSERDGPEMETSVFRFDSVFAPASQQDVFQDCRDLIQSAFDGFNVTIFAYGQTGSGKTYTMNGNAEQPGLAPRVMDELYRVAEKDMGRFQQRITASMVELYRNELVDLLQMSRLAPPSKKASMRTDRDGSVQFDNVIEEECDDREALRDLFERGNTFRKTAATAMNSESSRSHLIQTIKIRRINRQTGQVLAGKILLVDLAGSERLKKSLVTGDMQKDSIEINKSLTALGDVIEALTQGHSSIPYRNHKLTQVLQDALGRTAKTLMFTHCSPAKSNLEETLATLKYATRAKKIKRSSTPRGTPRGIAQRESTPRENTPRASTPWQSVLNDRCM